MNNDKKTYTLFGTVIGVCVMIAVAFVTAFNEKSSANVAAVVDNSGTIPTTSTAPVTPVVSTVPVKTSPSTPAKSPVAPKTTTPSVPVAVKPKQTSVYKDGTYTATGSYMSPGGNEQITVTITLANDIITSSSVTAGAYDHTSLRYQDMFISGYKQYVTGQNIANVNLTYVSGSSLTPAGFNSALAQIKAAAKA